MYQDIRSIPGLICINPDQEYLENSKKRSKDNKKFLYICLLFEERKKNIDNKK